MTDLPEPEEFGPKMLALDERRRNFVLFRVYDRKNPTQAAKASGFSGKTDGYLRVQGHRLMRQKAVMDALREEAERKFGVATAIALSRLSDRVESSNAKVQGEAIDSVLDRAGIGRKSVQDIRVEHTDNRSTAELLAEIRKMLPGASLPMIEGEVIASEE